MPELNPQLYPFDVQRPQLLQESGSIANAQNFNVVVKVSMIDRETTENSVAETIDTKQLKANGRLIENSREEVAQDNMNLGEKNYYTGMIAPYPVTNNFLHNKRSGVGTTQFQR